MAQVMDEAQRQKYLQDYEVAKQCRFQARKLHALANEAQLRDTRIANDCRALAVKLRERADYIERVWD